MVGFLPGYIMTKTWKRYWPPVMESRDETSLETHFCESRYQRFQLSVSKATGLGHKLLPWDFGCCNDMAS